MTSAEKNKQPSLQIPKAIVTTAKLLEKVAPSLLLKFAYKLFITPINYPTPEREKDMIKNSVIETCYIPAFKKKVAVYKYKNPDALKKVLLVHGWSGRGTQLFSIAKEMAKLGYQVISFDGPAHGKSEGKKSTMKEFIQTIQEVDKQYGPFEFVIGHSLGAMAVANALNEGLVVKKAVLISGGDIVTDVIADFVDHLKVDTSYNKKLQDKFEKEYQLKMNDYSVSAVAKNITIPCLIIHDTTDTDVKVEAAYNIHKHLPGSELVITEGLGHRKILGDKTVIQKIISFLN
ncbi:alpha/beta hydrolase [Flavobacterium agricola]|uniref:Alpha/beta hydrolase n=1 Tax=Flavobacterium agricola TaxID=2870839 RepID=A0ABY6M4H0_9FLAO|nr:alpha/beta hydrolase [Flavobacterium agricola]UYW02545.1 alpha/beta hydrolase [Flavobacterium agricola]